METNEEENGLKALPYCNSRGERVFDRLLFDYRGQEEYKEHLPQGSSSAGFFALFVLCWAFMQCSPRG